MPNIKYIEIENRSKCNQSNDYDFLNRLKLSKKYILPNGTRNFKGITHANNSMI
jgi:hypothetical protein